MGAVVKRIYEEKLKLSNKVDWDLWQVVVHDIVESVPTDFHSAYSATMRYGEVEAENFAELRTHIEPEIVDLKLINVHLWDRDDRDRLSIIFRYNRELALEPYVTIRGNSEADVLGRTAKLKRLIERKLAAPREPSRSWLRRLRDRPNAWVLEVGGGIAVLVIAGLAVWLWNVLVQ